MARVSISSTDDLAASDIATIRRLLDRSFGGGFDEHDWEHALGGHHAIVRASGTILAHGAVVPRTMWIGGIEQVVGYVEAVATEPEEQGRGLGSLAMRALGEVIAAHHSTGLLSTGAWHFYERLGWQRWEGPTRVRRMGGVIVRTPEEDDGAMVLSSHSEPIDRRGSIMCAERAGDDW